MTRPQITTAMKGTSEPVVLHELGPDEIPAAVLATYQQRAPKSVGIYLRRADDRREDGRSAAIMGRVRVA